MKASVIVPMWNGATYIVDCLDAVLSQGMAAVELIVVDDGSTDGSAAFVAKRFSTARVLRLESNQGFARACNHGLRAASGDLLVLLNQDTRVMAGWLEGLASAAAGTAVGIVGAKALYPDGRLQHAGGTVDDRGEGAHMGYRQTDDPRFEQPADVDFVTGASLALTRDCLERTGGLDEGFARAYYEDVDLCYRARQQGLRVVYTPRATLIHAEVSAVASDRHESLFSVHRNRLRFVLKHWPADRFFNRFIPAERPWLAALRGGGDRLIAAMHRVYLHHVLHLRDIARFRAVWHSDPPDTLDRIAEALISLRQIMPLPYEELDSDSIHVTQGASSRGWSSVAGRLVWPLPRRIVGLISRMRRTGRDDRALAILEDYLYAHACEDSELALAIWELQGRNANVGQPT